MNVIEGIFLIAALIAVVAAIRLVLKKGIVGSLYKGDLVETFGEIHFVYPKSVTHKFKVHKLVADGDASVALEYSARTFGSSNLIPMKLTKSETLQLAKLLEKAASEL